MATACFWLYFPVSLSSLIFLLIVLWLEPFFNGMPNKPRTGKYIECLHCSKEFYIPINRFETAKYCSRRCSALATRSRQITKCAICGNKFEHIGCRANNAKYCSRACYHKSQIGRGTKEFKCQHCDKIFLDSPSVKRKYCSRACINKKNKKIWKADFTTIRNKMVCRGMVRKCNRCEFDINPNILGIHHKDRNRNNNKLSNLEVLCPNCHSLEHSKHIIHSGKFN